MTMIFTDLNVFQVSPTFIINPVNCAGVMGAGFAKAMSQTIPGLDATYKKACKSGSLVPGRIQIVTTSGPYIVNLPTKNHWKDESTLDLIEAGLKVFSDNIDLFSRTSYPSISMPRIGCGLGGLNWIDVETIIRRHMSWHLVHICDGRIEIDRRNMSYVLGKNFKEIT